MNGAPSPMIALDNVTAETYCPLPFSDADYRRLRKAFRAHAPDVDLDHGYTETGAPFLPVGEPGAGFDDDWPIITRNERGWQMHRGGNGPLYEFATEGEVAEFLGSGGLGELTICRPEA
jgi:hypothetical protein